jgi:hypothetical protein
VSEAHPDEGFRVTDRRHRGAADEPPAAPAKPAAPAEGAGRAAGASERPGRSAPGPPDESKGEASLVGLFMMLASSAMIALGEAADPLTGQRHPDLEQAADAIDLLSLLRQRTEGNRTPEESQVLDQAIYDLQLRYVNARRRTGSPRGPARP